MAFTSRAAIVSGGGHPNGNRYAVIADASTNQLHEGSGRVSHVIVHDVGVTGSIVINDITAAGTPDATNKVWGWLSANGLGVFAIQCPIALGLEVVSAGGTPPKFTVVYDD